MAEETKKEQEKVKLRVEEIIRKEKVVSLSFFGSF